MIFQPKISPFQPLINPTSALPDILSIQQTESMRLQRLTQQRKRMQHMAQLIMQQKQAIQILNKQNQSINKQFYQLKLQNQLLNDKLIVSFNHSQDLTSIVLKQIHLIQKLKSMMFGDLHLNQYQTNLIIQQIQSCLTLFDVMQSTKITIPQFNYKQEINKLTQQNQILNQKYQQLCNNYLQLNKINKFKQFQLIKYQKTLEINKLNLLNHHNLSTQNYNLQKNISNPQKSFRNKNKTDSSQQIIAMKDKQINQLKIQIQNFKTQISHQNQLIKQHRKNQKQQKKLLTFLKTKFNQQGKQISQIAKSKNNVEPAPLSKSLMVYEIQLPVKKCTKIIQQTSNNNVFQQKNLNSNQKSNRGLADLNSAQNCKNSKIIQNNESGFKKTVSKNILEA